MPTPRRLRKSRQSHIFESAPCTRLPAQAGSHEACSRSPPTVPSTGILGRALAKRTPDCGRRFGLSHRVACQALPVPARPPCDCLNGRNRRGSCAWLFRTELMGRCREGPTALRNGFLQAVEASHLLRLTERSIAPKPSDHPGGRRGAGFVPPVCQNRARACCSYYQQQRPQEQPSGCAVGRSGFDSGCSAGSPAGGL